MKIFRSAAELKKLERAKSLCFVPTMGALHEGHLSLIDLAQNNADEVIVSIFVNPTQFAAGEDLDKYPRPIEEDIKKLQAMKVDYLFLPSVDDIYPEGPLITHHANPELSNVLCGLSRPGHFDGVVTVVYKLFDLVKPDFAVFGKKDYQQLLLIKDLVEKEKLGLKIIEAPILREADGLAMSSRNIYLNSEDRKKASALYENLEDIWASKKTINEAQKDLIELGFELDYLEEKWGNLFIAARLGSTRLIDNIGLDNS